MDELRDLFGAASGALGQLADLVGHDREAAARLAGPGRLDRGVEREQVRAVGDAGDDAGDLVDVAGLLLEIEHAAAGLLDLLEDGAHLLDREARDVDTPSSAFWFASAAKPNASRARDALTSIADAISFTRRVASESRSCCSATPSASRSTAVAISPLPSLERRAESVTSRAAVDTSSAAACTPPTSSINWSAMRSTASATSQVSSGKTRTRAERCGRVQLAALDAFGGALQRREGAGERARQDEPHHPARAERREDGRPRRDVNAQDRHHGGHDDTGSADQQRTQDELVRERNSHAVRIGARATLLDAGRGEKPSQLAYLAPRRARSDASPKPASAAPPGAGRPAPVRSEARPDAPRERPRPGPGRGG